VIDGSTRVYALLGDPVAHSLSPAMQNAAFRALGLPAVYVPLRCESSSVPGLLRALAAAGGGGNITIPHKEVAAGAVDRMLDTAHEVGVCNAFWAQDGEILGDNTDVAGVLRAVEALAPPEGPWLIVGTGGGARAAVVAAGRHRASVAVRSRSPERARVLEEWADARGLARARPAECAVVVNATPVGLDGGDELPVTPAEVPGAQVALDMVYRPGETAWVRALRAAGLRAADGRAMLVAQGAAALECWFPGVDAPEEIMRAAVDAALR
jgi:shikimate dehydrogenase